ncbi:hypothetical protein [Winogradskyella sp. 3972H.M.0a.05]|uniref:hypothetical protein n=1 Tax=Winogradskyella sp. 3972H.M.0a.05 TaxID=2950277 RepID=UPI00339B0FBF
MNKLQAPKYIRKIGDLTIVWFENTNNYILLDNILAVIFDLFLQSNSEIEFIEKSINYHNISSSSAKHYFYDFQQLLNENSLKESNEGQKTINTTCSKEFYPSELYRYNKKVFRINYASDKVKLLIHPLLEHLCIKSEFTPSTIVFSIDHLDNKLSLYQDDELIIQYPQRDYHMIQGKFAMLLINFLHHKYEEDWIGTFHGSTISDGKKAVLLVGNSGSGKSTFAALSMHNGYKLVADDISALLSENLNIYSYPAGISIKEGSYNVLKDYFSDLDTYNTHNLNPSKGKIRYLPSRDYIDKHCYSCNTILWINYRDGEKTNLEIIPKEEVLKFLIPESWLSPKPDNAKRFLDWLETIDCYKITYSNNKDVGDILKEVFS